MPWHYSLQCPGVWQWELLLQGLQHPPSKISHFSKSSPNCARYNITLDMTNCATLASSVQATIRYDRLRYVAHDNDSSRCCEQQCGLINAPVQSKKEIFLSLFLAAVFRWPCMLWSLVNASDSWGHSHTHKASKGRWETAVWPRSIYELFNCSNFSKKKYWDLASVIW